ncbi:hypothetical protein [Micromonospora sp. b486]|nr:hypothetical protein [Micromonospora sp. b486]MDM4784401.1 hypothetical protein [Micromonospora sp. b486]
MDVFLIACSVSLTPIWAPSALSVDWMFEPTATSGIIACVCGSSRS